MFVKFDENKIIEKYTKTFFIKEVLYFLTCFNKDEIVTSIILRNVDNIRYSIDHDCLELFKGTAKQNNNLFFEKIIPTNICNLLEVNFEYNGLLELEITVIKVELDYISELLKTNCYFVDIKYNTILMIYNGNHIVKKYSDDYKISKNMKYYNLNIIEIEPVYDQFVDLDMVIKAHRTYNPSIVKSTLVTNILINNIEKDNNLYKVYFFPVVYKTYINNISVVSAVNIKTLKIMDIELKDNEYLNFFNHSFLFYIEIESELSGFQIYDILINNTHLTYTNLNLNTYLLKKVETITKKIVTLDDITDVNKLKFYSFF